MLDQYSLMGLAGHSEKLALAEGVLIRGAASSTSQRKSRREPQRAGEGV